MAPAKELLSKTTKKIVKFIQESNPRSIAKDIGCSQCLKFGPSMKEIVWLKAVDYRRH